jgi:transposase-like protein
MRLESDLRFQQEEEAYRYVEACVWPQGPVCPRCGERKRIGRLKGASTRIGTCKCYRCRKPFTVKIGTALEGSHVLMHVWLKAILLTSFGTRMIAPKELAGVLEVSPRTAQFLSIRVRDALHGAPFREAFASAVEVLEMSSCDRPRLDPSNRQPFDGKPRLTAGCASS